MSRQIAAGRNYPAPAPATGARQIYKQLLDSSASPSASIEASEFLQDQLERAAHLPCDMPTAPGQLQHWMEAKALAVGERYANYLQGRKEGQARQYFSSKAQALAFLQGVAPTKLVDGAWLYGTLQHWQEPRFRPLIRTYLEELGDGDPAHNHVLLYQHLLAENGCELLPELSEQHYVQGAIQLALAHCAEQFMPEVIGYNLGYEQLPLHLLTSAFELAELGIDPYYFTLHVTVDNASSGHARKAVDSVLQCLPAAGDKKAFLDRVARGYRLNDLGIGSTDVIGSFDLESEVINMLERKRSFGHNLHSDYCRIHGHTVNEWLSQPGQCAEFLAALQTIGWIRRNEDPQNSRFWQLIEGPKAPMFGVFSRYEQQLLHDWIAGESLNVVPSTLASTGEPRPRQRRRFRPFRSQSAPASAEIDLKPNQEIEELQLALRRLSEEARMQRLVELMSPACHASAVGLWATRQFAAAIQ